MQTKGTERDSSTPMKFLYPSLWAVTEKSRLELSRWGTLSHRDARLPNLGIGYARASDCARQGNWLNRAVAGADLITVAFGTNDIISGPYGGTGHATPEEIEADVRKITRTCTDAGIRTILWNSPPFDMTPELD